MKNAICTVPGCGISHYVRKGLCNKHYHRWYRHGDPLAGTAGNGEPMAYIENIVLKYDGDDCLIWPYGKNKDYPAINFADGSRSEVHRYVCMRKHGRPPTKKHHAAHSCGMGKIGCVNPNHLRWATAKENAADKVLHGTHSRGVKSASAKIGEEQVREIRAAYGVIRNKDLSKIYNVTPSTIYDIQTRKTWAWLK